MRLFGRKREETHTVNESISGLKEAISSLEKRGDFLQQKIDKETADAKRYVASNNRRSALLCLKRKKTLEGQAEKLLASRSTLEEQLMSLESVSFSVDAINAMKMGAQSMKDVHKHMVAPLLLGIDSF